jgi:RNA polymerase sigma factor (sigma-70 family)
MSVAVLAAADLPATARPAVEQPSSRRLRLVPEQAGAGETGRVAPAADADDRLLRDPIGRLCDHDLLDADDEVALAYACAAGRDARERLVTLPPDPTTAAERDALETAIASGLTARDQLVTHNMRLVQSIARAYAGRGLALDDLIQEGVLGLMKAIERFDPSLGHRFSTYATWWVRQAVRRGLAEGGRDVRLPEHVVGLAGRVRRAAADIWASAGREPTTAELATATGATEAWVERAMAAMAAPVSLDAPYSEDGALTLADVVADDVPGAPEIAAERASGETLADLLGRLSDRERAVLMRRFGFDDGHELSLGEVAEHLGISRERVRQIEGKALEKLRRLGYAHRHCL